MTSAIRAREFGRASFFQAQDGFDGRRGDRSGATEPETGLSRAGCETSFISLAVSAFFIIFLYQPVKVEGTSMMPTLQDQERVFINKFVYKLEPIERGDVIVFRYPRDPAKSYIKRVIAVAGDSVRIEAGVVFVNGHRLSEQYLPRMYEDVRSYPDTVVPPHCYFVLGDHRNLSNDSRDFGSVDEGFIYGKAVFGYWPFAKLGTLR